MTQTTRRTSTSRRAAFVKDLVDGRGASIAAAPPPKRTCQVCRDPAVAARIDDLLVLAVPYKRIGEQMGISQTAISTHFTRCRLGDRAVLARLREEAKRGEAPADLAVLVRDEAARRLREGSLTITATHGLQAQGLIDRREEKQQDRQLALNLARLMSGASGAAPLDVIEGAFTDVSQDAPRRLNAPD